MILLGVSVCPLEILSPPHSTLESWIYEIHQRTLQLLMEFIQWQNIWRRVRCRYLFTWQYFLRDYYLCPQLKALSQDNLKIHSWVPGNFSSFHIHSGLGVVTASLPTLSKIVSLQIKSPWIIMPSVSRWEPDCITAVLHSSRSLLIYRPTSHACTRVFFPTQPYQCLTLTSFSPTWWIQ